LRWYKTPSSHSPKFCTKGSQTLLFLPGTRKENFSFHFKRYILTIREVNFFETFCTCSPSNLRQDFTVKSAKNYFYFSFELLELEMADLKWFFERNDLHPLGDNYTNNVD
jgi:hypothetical protein